MEDLNKSENKTIQSLIYKNREQEKEITRLEAKLELMQELFTNLVDSMH